MERNTEDREFEKWCDTRNNEKAEKACKKTVEFIVLIRGRNCKKTIVKCLRSLKRQTYPYWRAIIALDAPTDGSYEFVKDLIFNDDCFAMVCRDKHFGLCKNMYCIIGDADRLFKPEKDAVAAILDADDYLAKRAFETVAKKYVRYPEIKITHGSYMKVSKNKRTKVSKAYPKSGDIRKLPWRGSHLKTIKWDVIVQIRMKWFIYKEAWLEAASDLALMFGCVDIVGLSKVKHIHDIIYYWNDNVTKKKRIVQKRCEKILRAK